MEYVKVKDYEINKMDVSEEGEFFVLSFTKEIHMKVGELAKKIIEKLDGTRTLNMVIEELAVDGIELNEKDMVSFIDDKLKNKGLLENTEFKKQKSRMSVHLPLLKGEKMDFILTPLSYLFRKKIALTVVAVVILTQIYVIFTNNYLSYGNLSLTKVETIIATVIIIFSGVFHELGHAAAAKFYGAKVGNLGVGLYFYWPVFYTDLSCMWQFDKKKRIVTNIGGIYFQMLYMFFIVIALIITGNDLFKMINMLFLFSLWRNLNPIIRSDGYWIISDLFGIVNLNERAYRIFIQIVRGMFKGKISINFPFNIKKKMRPFFYTFLIVYLVAMFCIMAFAIYYIVNAIINTDVYINIFSSLFGSLSNGDFEGFLKILGESSGTLFITILMFFTVFSMLKGIFKTEERKR